MFSFRGKRLSKYRRSKYHNRMPLNSENSNYNNNSNNNNNNNSNNNKINRNNNSINKYRNKSNILILVKPVYITLK